MTGKERSSGSKSDAEANNKENNPDKRSFFHFNIWPLFWSGVAACWTIVIGYFASNPNIFYLIPIILFACSSYAVHKWVVYLKEPSFQLSPDTGNPLPVQQKDQRAWIATVNDGTPHEGVIETGKPITITIPIRNIGKTLAKGVRVGQFCQVIYTPGIPDFKEEDELLKKGIGSTAVLAPGDTVALTATIKEPLTAELATKIQSGDARVFVFGKVVYMDIFGDKHWTIFCYYLRPDNLRLVTFITHNDFGDDDP